VRDSLVNYLISGLAVASLEFLFVGFLVTGLLALRPGISPVWRRRIWLLAMFKPFVTVLTGFFPGLVHLPSVLTAGSFLGDLLSPHGGGDSFMAQGGSGAAFLKGLAYFWMFGTAVMLLRVWRRAAVSNSMIDEALRRGFLLKPSTVRSLDPTLEVAENARIVITPDGAGPATLGAWRSVVVIPENLLPWLNDHRGPTRQERDRFLQVLRHELSHLSRRDDLANMLAAITVAFFWFHPVAHWAYNRLRINNELCCDMQVVSSGVAPADYINTLMTVVTGRFDRKGFSIGILGDGGPANVLKRRLHFLLSDEVDNASADRSKLGYLIVGLMLLTLPRFIAPALSTFEAITLDGTVVQVTLEQFESNPSLRLIGSPTILVSSSPSGAEPGKAASPRNGSFIDGEFSTGETQGDDPQPVGPTITGEGEALANPSDEEIEDGETSQDERDDPKKKSRGRGWSDGPVPPRSSPDAPILPLRPPQ